MVAVLALASVLAADSININTASESEIKSLPGVDAKVTQIILDGRTYMSIADFSAKLQKAGVPIETIDVLKLRVNVGVNDTPANRDGGLIAANDSGLGSSQSTVGEIRQALVIGNNKHPVAPLTRPVNDALAVQRALKDLGFGVTLLTDATQSDMDRGISTFIQDVKKDSVVIVYFAGHGVEVGNYNYLLPTDLDAKDDFDVQSKAVSVNTLLDELERTPARIRLLVLDANPDNPYSYRRVRSPSVGGLAPQVRAGSYVAFATMNRTVARDSATNGQGVDVFTAELVKELENKRPGSTVDQMFTRVRSQVAALTSNEQVPFSTSGLRGEWYPFGPGTPRDLVAVNHSMEIGGISMDVNILSPDAASEPSKGGDLRIGEKDRQSYVFVPAGSFQMGCAATDRNCDRFEKPAHRVNLTRGFWLGQTEVTVQAYQAFTTAVGHRMPAPVTFKGNRKATGDPISNVTYDDAASYCEWAGGRLPSEAEWEYGARAGTSTIYPWGEVADHEHANYFGTSRNVKTGRDKFELAANGRSFPPNAWGIYDMVGNVAEFVADFYSAYAEETVTDPRGPAEGEERIVRGGSWAATAIQLRTSSRERVKPGFNANYVGFRCVLGEPSR